MRNLRKVLSLLAVFAMLFTTLTGCSKETSQEATPVEKKVIGISMNAADEYCTALLAVMESQAKAAGYEVISTNAGGQANKQISDMESLIVQEPNVIIMRAVDPAASSPAAKAAMDAGIKLVIIDLPVFESDYNIHLTSDQARVGELLGNYLNEWLDADTSRSAKLGYIKGNDIPPTAPRREAILTTCPRVEELANATTTPEWSAASAQSITSDWLTSYPEMNVIAAMSDELANGAIQALTTAGKNLEDYLLFGCDGSQNGLLAIKNGQLNATVLTDPESWGTKAVDLAVDLDNNPGNYELNTEIDGADAMVLVTSDNVDQYLNK